MQYIMKKLNNILCLIIGCVFLFSSCSEEEGVEAPDGGAPAAVSDVTAKSGPGEVILKWKAPVDDNLYYVDIQYTDSKGVAKKKQVSKFAIEDSYMTDTIDGFVTTDDYKFTLTARNLSGAASAPVEITGKPDKSILEIIPATIDMKPDFGGAVVTWTNTTGKDARVSVTYSVAGSPVRNDFNANKSGSGTISELSAEKTVFTVTVQDKYGNASEGVIFELTPLAEVKISKDKWSIPGYVENSPNGTIGYSSQATSGEGSAPGGRAVAILDDNVSTFWHASYQGGLTSTYPHWIVIDLGEELTISRVTLTRRQNNASGQKGQQILTCTAAGATDPTNSLVWAWADQGTSDFSQVTLGPQSFRLSNNPKARYLKIYFPAALKGTGNYAILADVQVYGSY